MKKVVAIILGMAIAISCIGMSGCSEKKDNMTNVDIVNSVAHDKAYEYVSEEMGFDSFELEPYETDEYGVVCSYYIVVDGDACGSVHVGHN